MVGLGWLVRCRGWQPVETGERAEECESVGVAEERPHS